MKDEYSTLLYEYNELILLLGYVILFSVVAPMTPFIVFIVMYFYKLGNSYRLVFQKRISIITPSDGIEIYKYILAGFFIIGVITNVFLLLFANPNLKNASILLKFCICFTIENSLIIVLSFMSFNILPWCKNMLLVQGSNIRI